MKVRDYDKSLSAVRDNQTIDRLPVVVHFVMNEMFPAQPIAC